MEIPQKNITFSLPDDDTPGEESDFPMRNSMELLKNRIDEVTKNFADTLQIGQALTQAMRPALESLAKSIISAQELSFALKPLQDALANMTAAISDIVRDITIPELSEERKQEILASQQKWGALGWTWFQNAPKNFYDEPPADVRVANTKVKPFCSSMAMDNLFCNLQNQKIRKQDLDSAIFCYKNRHYKACALLLFGLIDAELIKKQPKSSKKRQTGKSAVNELRKNFERNSNTQAFYIVLRYANLFSCLEAFFAPGNDFRTEPPIVNRNFLSHGMTQRQVRKRDCIQLFLALSNLNYCMGDLHF